MNSERLSSLSSFLCKSGFPSSSRKCNTFRLWLSEHITRGCTSLTAHYRHLTIDDRIQIQTLHDRGKSKAEISRSIGGAPFHDLSGVHPWFLAARARSCEPSPVFTKPVRYSWPPRTPVFGSSSSPAGRHPCCPLPPAISDAP